MTTYATGNPLGSTAVKDLYDNAQNLDDLVNGPALQYPDRFGVARKSYKGIETDALNALEQVGYVYTGPVAYAAGITITLPNQIFEKDGEYYKIAPGVSLPYVTTGMWGTESVNFRSVGDAALRRDLAGTDGVQNIAGAQATVATIAALKALSVSKASKWATVQNAKFVSFYRYDAASSATADDVTVVAPTVGGGRWLINHNGSMHLYQWGVVGDAVADDTTKVQAAVTWAGASALELIVPSCVGIKLTATIAVAGSPRLTGEQIRISKNAALNVSDPGLGSWFYIAHTGIGFKFNDLSTVVQRPVLEMVGTYRDQPVPSSGAYTPTAHGYDLYYYNCDTVIKNIAMWNPTKAIYITANAANSQSRGDISGVYGCPYERGIVVDFLADVIRIDNVHWWPYTSGNTTVADYIRANCIGLSTYRCDNPMVTRYFTYGLKHSILVGKNALGTTSKMKLSMFDFDAFGAQAILVTGAGASGSITQGVAQGQNSTTTECFLELGPATSGCNFAVDNIDVGLCGKNVLRCGGTSNNVLRVGANVRLYQWNGTGIGWPAVDCTPNNFVELASMPYFTAPLNSGTNLGTAGSIKARMDLPPQIYNTDPAGKVAMSPGMGRAPSSIIATAINDSTALHVQQTNTPNVVLVATVATGAALVSSPVTMAAHMAWS